MELDFNKIVRLKKINEEKKDLINEEKVLASPILTDRSLVKDIYSIFTDILNERGCPPCIESVTQRKKFIFIILYLFSPGTLAGGKILHGLRSEIADAIGKISGTSISNNCDDVVFLYQNYRDFSGDIEYLYTEILKRLRCKGLINEKIGD